MPKLSDSEINDSYRERANALLAQLPEDGDGAPFRITINQHAAVQVCEGGAFVECQLWVPDSTHVSASPVPVPVPVTILFFHDPAQNTPEQEAARQQWIAKRRDEAT